jgi:Fe-S cluster assembly protein SufB
VIAGWARFRRIDVDQYKYGFVTDIESDRAPKGLSEDSVRFISAKKDEPSWLTEWRLGAYRRWLIMQEPRWARVEYPQIDYQDLLLFLAQDGRRSKIPRRSRSGIA